jgi:phosphocarrier protein
MKTLEYKITDELGIHARPAGELVKKAKEFDSELIIAKGESKCDLKHLFAIMKLGIKQNDVVTIKITGEDEEKAAVAIEKFLKSNL